ncbi:hypothetical protein IPC729_20025 [Pseudomonas aeruginosa]|nr:hypothetical protein IPC729_20025 [Pseudomonas aeruginosa]
MDIQPTQTDIGADGFLGDEAARRQSMPAWLSAGGKGHSERKVRRTGANLALVIHNSAWAEPHYLPMQKLEKMRPSRSSGVNAPVISPRCC